MRFNLLAKTIALISASTLVAACFDDAKDNLDAVEINAYLLTSDNRIVGIDLDQPRLALSSVSVSNALDSGEEILDIDYRNSEGTLYALTRTGTQGRVIIINPQSGAITRVSTLVSDAADNSDGNPNYVALASSGTDYTIDFNPVVDRLRAFGSDGSNLRIDALTGDTFTDGDVNGATDRVTGAAYTDTSTNGRSTTLFTMDAVTDSLYTTNANAGTLSAPKLLGVGNVTAINGYDIRPENNAGIALLTVANQTQLYSIDAAAMSGQVARRLGSVPALRNQATYKGVAVVTTANPTVTALNSANQLITFRAQSPEVTSSPTTVSSLPQGVSLLTIDFRQSNRVLYGLASNGGIYSLTPAMDGSITAALVTTITLTPDVNYSADFNPTIPSSGIASNRLRLIGDDDSNAVVNIDATAPGNVTPNTPVSGTPNPEVVSSAYLNNYRNTTATTLYVIDRASASLNIQTVIPPTAPATRPAVGELIPIAPLGITPVGPVGFDISGRNNDNALLMARASASGPHTLYRINTSATSNPLTTVGQIGVPSGSPDLLDIAIRF